MSTDNRGPWIIAVGIVLTAAVVWWQSTQSACEDWQDDFRTVSEAAMTADGMTQEDSRQLGEVMQEQPKGCESPQLRP